MRGKPSSLVFSAAMLFAAAIGPACDCHAGGLVLDCGLLANPPSLDFGSVAVGQSATLSVTLENTGSAPLTISSSAASGDPSFQVESFATETILSGASVKLQITFNPTAAGPHTATLDLQTTACGSDVLSVSVTGIGETVGVEVSPASLQFGCEAVNGQSTAQTVTLTNDSNPPGDETVTISRAAAPDFQLPATSESFDLPPDASVDVSVIFAPTGIGADQETIEITACGADGGGCSAAITYPLSGTGAGTALVATPSSVSFPFLPMGDDASQLVTVAAVSLGDGGDCALPAVVSVPILLTNNVGFSLEIDGGWPMTLTPPQSFSMVVDFTSGGQTLDSDVAVVAYTVGGAAPSPLDIPINAQVIPGPCQLTVTPPSVSFGSVAQGQTVTEPVSVCNDNDAGALCLLNSFTITQNDAANEFSVSDAGATVPFAFAPGSCGTFDVSFTTANTNAPLQRDGTLTLTVSELDSDAGGIVITEPLSATAVQYAHTGQVLVTGGTDGTNTLGTAEIYDEPTAKWTLTGPMTTPRQFHTANLLPLGNTLVAGGTNSSGDLMTSELYNPGTGVWTATTGLMTYAPGSLPQATLLQSGKVLMAGGDTSAGGFESQSSIYDPVSQTWSPAGSLLMPMNNYTAALLPSGQVLASGGGLQCCTDFTAVAQLFDPVGGTWTATGSIDEAVAWNPSVTLSTGKVLLVGGDNSSGSVVSECDLYDPTAGTWTPTGSMGTARDMLVVAVLGSGKVLAIGGSTVGYPSQATGVVEIYDPVAATWTPTGSLNTPRIRATATLLPSGKVLVTGGSDSSGSPTASCELYDPVAGTWAPTASLSVARANHTATPLPL